VSRTIADLHLSSIDHLLTSLLVALKEPFGLFPFAGRRILDPSPDAFGGGRESDPGICGSLFHRSPSALSLFVARKQRHELIGEHPILCNFKRCSVVHDQGFAGTYTVRTSSTLGRRFLVCVPLKQQSKNGNVQAQHSARQRTCLHGKCPALRFFSDVLNLKQGDRGSLDIGASLIKISD
jgi:hypothetical protein